MSQPAKGPKKGGRRGACWELFEPKELRQNWIRLLDLCDLTSRHGICVDFPTHQMAEGDPIQGILKFLETSREELGLCQGEIEVIPLDEPKLFSTFLIKTGSNHYLGHLVSESFYIIRMTDPKSVSEALESITKDTKAPSSIVSGDSSSESSDPAMEAWVKAKSRPRRGFVSDEGSSDSSW